MHISNIHIVSRALQGLGPPVQPMMEKGENNNNNIVTWLYLCVDISRIDPAVIDKNKLGGKYSFLLSNPPPYHLLTPFLPPCLPAPLPHYYNTISHRPSLTLSLALSICLPHSLLKILKPFSTALPPPFPQHYLLPSLLPTTLSPSLPPSIFQLFYSWCICATSSPGVP